MFNVSREIVNNVFNTYDNACYTIGKYYIDKIELYDYINFKAFYDHILLFMILRYSFFYLNEFIKMMTNKEFLIKIRSITEIQFFIFKIRKNYFNDWKEIFKMDSNEAFNKLFPIITINPFLELYDFMLNLIEIRIIILIVFLVL